MNGLLYYTILYYTTHPPAPSLLFNLWTFLDSRLFGATVSEVGIGVRNGPMTWLDSIASCWDEDRLAADHHRQPWRVFLLTPFPLPIDNGAIYRPETSCGWGGRSTNSLVVIAGHLVMNRSNMNG